VQNISPTNGSAYVKYNGTNGVLKGFSANLGVTYVSRTPSESPSAGEPLPNAFGVVTGTSTEQWKLNIPSFTLWNVGLHYRLRTTPKFEQALHLNVNNVFDHDYLKVNKNLGDRRAVYVSYSLTFSGYRH